MPQTRTADIRTTHIATTLMTTPLEEKPEAKQLLRAPLIKREFARVMLCTLPLIGILVIGYYLDTTSHWVVELASRFIR